MMNDIRIPYLQSELNSQLVDLLTPLIGAHHIPTKAKRIAVNIRPHEVNCTHCRFQPIEMQLERQEQNKPWQLRFIATFDVINTQPVRKELSLYFNFVYGWFYHPETKQCALNHPEVLSLLHSWLMALSKSLKARRCPDVTLTTIGQFN